MPCTKRPFRSVQAARSSARQAAWRIRTYRCPECGYIHLSNADKEGPERQADRHYNPERRHYNRKDPRA